MTRRARKLQRARAATRSEDARAEQNAKSERRPWGSPWVEEQQFVQVVPARPRRAPLLCRIGLHWHRATGQGYIDLACDGWHPFEFCRCGHMREPRLKRCIANEQARFLAERGDV